MLFNKPMPIVITDSLLELNPKCFWLGGGDNDVKVRKILGVDY